jgi:hypothetical protein
VWRGQMSAIITICAPRAMTTTRVSGVTRNQGDLRH